MPPGEWWAGGGPRLAPSSREIVGPDEPGQRLIVSGTVYGDDGRTALPGVTVYDYQTDIQGLYNREGRFGAPHRLKGWANTDLGCAYVLDADRNGDGVLSVTEGWAQLEGRAYNPIVPAGADARTRRGQEPGSPYYRDASSEFVASLAVVDFGAQPSREAALRALLAQARPRDSLTLLSLLGRLSDSDRAAIYPRLAVLLPPPAGVTRDRIAAGDRSAIDRWWEALALPRPRKIYPRLWGFGR